MPPRNIALVGALCVIAGWLLASTVAPPVARVQSRPVPREKPSDVQDPLTFTDQLQLRLSQPPPAPQGRRNPFVFAEQSRPSTAAPPPVASPTAPLEPPAVSVGPAYVLSGIGISGDDRTAILTTTGEDVHLLKLNDHIGGYRVAEIAEAAVTLVKGDARIVLRFAQ